MAGMTKSHPIGFQISISARDDGTLEALYVYYTHAPVAKTEELIEDVLLADYTADGELVGFEILAPVPLAELEKRVPAQSRVPFRTFLEHGVPRELVLA